MTLGLLKEMGDRDKKKEYVLTILMVLQADEEAGEWRASWPFEPKYHRYPWVPTKIGYINKLENEGLVEKTHQTNSTTRYGLTVPPEAVLNEVEEIAQTLDEDVRDELDSTKEQLGSTSLGDSECQGQ